MHSNGHSVPTAAWYLLVMLVLTAMSSFSRNQRPDPVLFFHYTFPIRTLSEVCSPYFVQTAAVNPDVDEGSVAHAGSGTVQSHLSPLAELTNLGVTMSRKDGYTSVLRQSTQNLLGAWPSMLGTW